MRKQTFNKIAKINAQDLHLLRSEAKATPAAAAAAAADAATAPALSKKDLKITQARVTLGFVIMNEVDLMERDYSKTLMRPLRKKDYAFKLKTVFPTLTKLQRAEVKQVLRDAGFKIKKGKIRDFRPN